MGSVSNSSTNISSIQFVKLDQGLLWRFQSFICVIYLFNYTICHEQNKDEIDNMKSTKAGAVHREELQLRDPKNYTTQRNTTQRNATQRNATQRNATQRNATHTTTVQHTYKQK